VSAIQAIAIGVICGVLAIIVACWFLGIGGSPIWKWRLWHRLKTPRLCWPITFTSPPVPVLSPEAQREQERLWSLRSNHLDGLRNGNTTLLDMKLAAINSILDSTEPYLHIQLWFINATCLVLVLSNPKFSFRIDGISIALAATEEQGASILYQGVKTLTWKQPISDATRISLTQKVEKCQPVEWEAHFSVDYWVQSTDVRNIFHASGLTRKELL